jgi:phosphonopyruvate decarboxylase
MIEAECFIQNARKQGFELYAGVPCSYLKPFINYVIDSDELRYIGAANEGDAVAIAAGAQIGGSRAVAMFQNSGLGNAVNPLTSLTYTFRIPILVITTFRGEPGGAPDEPQHELMGAITPRMLELMEIPWSYFPTETGDVVPVLERAVAHMESERRPYALVMKKGSVARSKLKTEPEVRSVTHSPVTVAPAAWQRQDMLRAVQSVTGDNDIVIATTGYMGRELYACDDRANQLYMVGSMGCAVSLGLGLAAVRPDKRVIVLDGDGASLMRLGALTTVGYERPSNLVHVLLDNGIHESTGGQATVSPSIDFCGLAAASGYPQVMSAASPDVLASTLNVPASECSFIYVPILPGVPDGLPRPTMTPAEVAARLRRHLSA